MRRLTVLLLIVVAACGAEAISTTSSPAVTTSSTVATRTTGPANPVADATTTSGAPQEMSSTTIAPLEGLALERVDVEVSFPTLVFASIEQQRSYVVDKAGVIVPTDGGPPLLDISSQVRNDGEQGLLGATFFSLDAADDTLDVHYSDRDGNTVVSAFDLAAGQVDAGSERIVLQVEQPARNHNGGMIQTDPDGYLYIALGDGGGANDRYGNGQNLSSLLGTILRLELTGESGYQIPPDNPFTDVQDARPEIWAYGLRNPWRFWIDAPTGRMIIADVGQKAYEEVDVVGLEPVERNFGWPTTEALHCFSPSSGCDTGGLTLPVLEVEHGDAGTCSITGGIVYRGDAIPELDGVYLFSDYCGGYLRGFPVDDPASVADYTEMVGGPIGQVTSFGQGWRGELYVTTADGSVFEVVPIR